MKDQENPDDQKQEEVVPVPLINLRILRQGEKWALQLLKSDIENSNICSFSSSTAIQDQNRINGIWYR